MPEQKVKVRTVGSVQIGGETIPHGTVVDVDQGTADWLLSVNAAETIKEEPATRRR